MMNFLVLLVLVLVLVHVVVVSSLCSYSLYCFDFAVLSLTPNTHTLYSALLNWSINVPAITAITNKGGIKNVLVSKVIRGKIYKS